VADHDRDVFNGKKQIKVTNTINQHWQRQNSRKKSPTLNGAQNGHSRPVDLAELDGGR
jgi:hypothetical protein